MLQSLSTKETTWHIHGGGANISQLCREVLLDRRHHSAKHCSAARCARKVGLAVRRSSAPESCATGVGMQEAWFDLLQEERSRAHARESAGSDTACPHSPFLAQICHPTGSAPQSYALESRACERQLSFARPNCIQNRAAYRTVSESLLASHSGTEKPMPPQTA